MLRQWIAAGAGATCLPSACQYPATSCTRGFIKVSPLLTAALAVYPLTHAHTPMHAGHGAASRRRGRPRCIPCGCWRVRHARPRGGAAAGRHGGRRQLGPGHTAGGLHVRRAEPAGREAAVVRAEAWGRGGMGACGIRRWKVGTLRTKRCSRTACYLLLLPLMRPSNDHLSHDLYCRIATGTRWWWPHPPPR